MQLKLNNLPHHVVLLPSSKLSDEQAPGPFKILSRTQESVINLRSLYLKCKNIYICLRNNTR